MGFVMYLSCISLGDIVKKALPKEGGLEKDKKGRMPYRGLSIEGGIQTSCAETFCFKSS